MKRVPLILAVILPLLALFALLPFFTPAVQAGDVGGVIDVDTTWTLAGSPYIITDTVIITGGVTLTVEAGVEVQAQPGTSMEVNGTLLALGTPSQPVTFTSSTENGPGDWEGIIVESSGRVSLTLSTISYGTSSVRFAGANTYPVQLTDSTLSYNEIGLVATTGSLHLLQMRNVTFTNNTSNRVIIDPYLSNDTLSDNVTLTPQPSLEGYEINHYELRIPAGITLTLEAGVIFFQSEDLGIVDVHGHLQANGTTNAPVVFTNASDNLPTVWDAIVVSGSGSIDLVHTLIQGSGYSLIIAEPTDSPVRLTDSMFLDNESGPIVGINALHRLEMQNVTFNNSGQNRITLEPYNGETLTDDVTLTPQPGLEGYEMNHYYLEIPAGITLTLEAGVTFFQSENEGVIGVSGHLQSNGTANAPIVFANASDKQSTVWDGIYVWETGSVDLVHAVIQDSNYSLTIWAPTDRPVLLSDTTFQNNANGPVVNIEALHRLHMDHVTFNNNARNRVFISTTYFKSLTDDVVLTPQSGLEGYEVLWYSGRKNFVIPQGISLTVAAGTTVLMPQEGELLVGGRLVGEGTAVSPITITSSLDSGPGQWAGIVVSDGLVSLAHTDLRFAENAISLTTPGSQVTISRSRVLSSSQSGIVVQDGVLNVACTAVAQHGAAGVFVGGQENGNPQATLYSSRIWGNGQAGITHTHGSPARAVWNWWGDPSGPGGEGPGSGDAIYGAVSYDPWLTAPACLPPLPNWQIFLPIMAKP